MKYVLHPGAEDDLREAAEFYREHAGSLLWQSFLAEFGISADTLLEHPMLGAPWKRGSRRLLLASFPYSLIYAIAEDEIGVVAVAHQSRRPGYWRGRKWSVRAV